MGPCVYLCTSFCVYDSAIMDIWDLLELKHWMFGQRLNSFYMNSHKQTCPDALKYSQVFLSLLKSPVIPKI